MELKSNISISVKYHAIFLNESWLDDSILDSELSIPGFQYIRLDRDFIATGKSRAGGLLVYIKNGVSFQKLISKNYGIEHIMLKISFNNVSFLVTLVYIPPVTSILHEDIISDMLQLIHNITKFGVCNGSTFDMILLGDFNLPGYTWFQDNDLQSVSGTNQFKVIRLLVERLKELANSFNLRQCITQSNLNGNFLDLCFTNFSDISCDVSLDPLCKLDIHHHAYYFAIKFDCMTNLSYNLYDFDFRRGDYQGLNSAIGTVNWSFLNNEVLSLDDKLEKFYNILYEHIACYVPMANYTISDSPPWFNREIREAIKLKLKYHKLWKSSGYTYYYNKFSNQRAHCKYLNKYLYLNYINDIQINIGNDSRKFWRYVNIKGNNN